MIALLEGNQCKQGLCQDGTCVLVPKADATPCEDGIFCTSKEGEAATADQCLNGQCVSVPVICGVGDQCNDNCCNEETNSCELVPKADSTFCEDGFFCTSKEGEPGTADQCLNGQCIGVPVICGVGDQCNDNVCNKETNSCGLVPKADSTPCEDGFFCTSNEGEPGTADQCLNGQCVGVPVSCGVGDQCNDNVCNEETNSCELVPRDFCNICNDTAWVINTPASGGGCVNTLPDIPSEAWGWYIGPLSPPYSERHDIYQGGAAGCDINSGTKVGSVQIQYDTALLNLRVRTIVYALYGMDAKMYLYAGTEKLPEVGGVFTADGDKFTVADDLTGENYVAIRLDWSILCA